MEDSRRLLYLPDNTLQDRGRKSSARAAALSSSSTSFPSKFGSEYNSN